MGCNFYVNGIHIGKRSAAGFYCWDCGVTLCKGGEQDIHSGYAQWNDECPKCGKKKIIEGVEHNSAGRELGFNKEPFGKKTGVKSCSSFSWDMIPEEFDNLDEKSVIIDEYGREYSMAEFSNVLEECPIRFFWSIGMEFS